MRARVSPIILRQKESGHRSPFLCLCTTRICIKDCLAVIHKIYKDYSFFKLDELGMVMLLILPVFIKAFLSIQLWGLLVYLPLTLIFVDSLFRELDFLKWLIAVVTATSFFSNYLIYER